MANNASRTLKGTDAALDTEPSVRIWRDASGDNIEIEGMDELVPVGRV
jgi:hypothetical protein